MKDGSIITGFYGPPLRRGSVVEIDGKQFKVLAVKSGATLEIGPLRWWERLGHKALWFVRSLYERVSFWLMK